jgi:16S rRNA (cytosine967-C5)-methyltransferase
MYSGVMKQAARINTVIEVLDKIASSRIPMDATVGDYMRHRRYIGSKDRAYIVEMIYSIVRARARLEWHLNRYSEPLTARQWVITWLALGEQMPGAQIAQLFDGTEYGPQPLTPVERDWLESLKGKALEDPAMPDATRVECPPQHEAALRAYFGKDFEAEMKAMMTGAPLDLRVNTQISEREKVRGSLISDKVPTAPTPWSPWGLRAENKAFLSKTRAFLKGWIDIQDEGSQLIAYVCDAKPGMQVLDYCAGAGGKTLALAAAMQKKGRIVAMDTEAPRLEKGRQRFRRAHVSDIIEVRPLTDEKNRKWLRRQKETFDVVLADVPCSSTGTWRRNPDLRWNSYGPSLEELKTTQAEILDKVAKSVKPGGRLVYATCSLLPEENENQVEAFLARHDEFEVLPLDKAWPEGTTPPNDGPYMRLTPRRHNTDGFFAAVLRRRAVTAPDQAV